MRIRVSQDITIEVAGTDEWIDKLETAVCNEYPSIEWSTDYITGGIVMTATETVIGEYTPAVLYTPNGDGSPAEYDYYFEVEEGDLKDFCEKFVKSHNLTDEDLYIESVSCYDVDGYDYCDDDGYDD